MTDKPNDIELAEGQSNSLLNEKPDESTNKPNNEGKKSKEKSTSCSDILLIIMGIALVTCGAIARVGIFLGCPGLDAMLFDSSYLFIVIGAVAVISGLLSWFIESKLKKKSVVILTLAICPLLFLATIPALVWSYTDLESFKDLKGNYSTLLPKLFEDAKLDFMKVWLENYKGDDLSAKKCWMSVEKVGNCCGFNGPQDWLNISGSMSDSCICYPSKGKGQSTYPGYCKLMRVPAWGKSSMINDSPCSGGFLVALESKLVALVASSAVALPIFFLPFICQLYSRIKKCRKG